MEPPTLIDQYFPAHGNWYGLSLGWVSTSWLSSIVSRGHHRLAHVEPWVANRLLTLKMGRPTKRSSALISPMKRRLSYAISVTIAGGRSSKAICISTPCV